MGNVIYSKLLLYTKKKQSNLHLNFDTLLFNKKTLVTHRSFYDVNLAWINFFHFYYLRVTWMKVYYFVCRIDLEKGLYFVFRIGLDEKQPQRNS